MSLRNEMIEMSLIQAYINQVHIIIYRGLSRLFGAGSFFLKKLLKNLVA